MGVRGGTIRWEGIVELDVYTGGGGVGGRFRSQSSSVVDAGGEISHLFSNSILSAVVGKGKVSKRESVSNISGGKRSKQSENIPRSSCSKDM